MRRTFISLVILAIALIVLGATSAPKSNAKSNPALSPQDEPGTRCTRLSWPKEKKKPEAQAGVYIPGSRCERLWTEARKGEFMPNRPPKVGLSSSSSHLGAGAPTRVDLETIACDREGDSLLYTYSTTGGRITGDGVAAAWDLGGVRPGTYTVTVEVDDGCGCISFSSRTVTVGG